MVKKHISRRKKNPILLSRAILERKLIEVERKRMALKDLDKLYKQGFMITSNNTFSPRQTNTSRMIMERILRDNIKKHPKNILLKNAQIKRVQHPNRNIKTYILVTKGNVRR